jgi:hypothetical protein
MAAVDQSFEIQKIHDTVWVFKNAIKDSDQFVDYFENNREWKDWYTFGKMTVGSDNEDAKFQDFPSQEEWDNAFNQNLKSPGEDGYFENHIDNLFYEATKLYVEENSQSFDNWLYRPWNVAKYIPNLEHHAEYAMMHHTDFQREFSYNPGSKFGVTCVAYLNDNYTGGDVMFRFLDENDRSVIKEDYSYKPQAGDIVIFMSGHPHYHGVRAVTEGEKYIIRMYWMYEYQGHPLWLALKEKYGEDIWNQMEDARLKYNRNEENVTIVNNIPFWEPFEEYYSKEIESISL